MRSSFLDLKLFFLVAALLYSTGILYAQHFVFDGKAIPDPSPNSQDQFGWDISAFGNFMLVGAPLNDKNGLNSGSAFLYELVNDDWQLIARFEPTDPQSSATFGKSVFMTNDVIAIGAPYQDVDYSDAGAVYIYKKPTEGWSDAMENLKITNVAPYENASLGESIHIHGDYIIAGAAGPNTSLGMGAAFIFKQFDNWSGVTELARLESSDDTQVEGNLFGSSVFMDDEQAIVGAPRHDFNDEFNPGSVFVFNKPIGEWESANEDAILRPSVPVYMGQFGNRISYKNGALMVSNNFGLNWNTTPGSAYIFLKPAGGWIDANESIKIEDPLALPSTQFATDVLIDEYFAYVSALFTDGGDGKVYVYANSNGDWSGVDLVANLTHNETGRKIQSGKSIAVSNGMLFSGAYMDNDQVSSSGSVLVYDQPAAGWTDMSNRFRIAEPDVLASNNRFGGVIDMYENFAVVGAKYDADKLGIAYLFENKNGVWEKIAKLSPATRTTNGLFGKAVAIYDEWIAVSALNPEKVFMFKKPESGWQDMNETTTIFPQIEDGGFGYSVDIYENTVVVGTSNSHSYPESGVYLFEISGSTWQGGTESMRLGKSEKIRFRDMVDVNVCKNTIVVGAPMLNKVFVYQKNGDVWPDVAIREFGKGEYSDRFGYSVSLYENRIAVGAPANDAYALNAGTVYIYEAPSYDWTSELRVVNVTAPEPKVSSSYGHDVSLYKNHLIIGAPYYSKDGKSVGAVFDYLNDKDDWLNITPDVYFSETLIDGNRYGSAIALNDNYLLLADELDDTDLGENSGSVAFFRTAIGMQHFNRPSGVSVSLKEDAMVDVNWLDNSTGEKGFTIEFSVDSNFYSFNHTSVSENTSIINNLYISQQDTIVHFRVRAFSDYYTTPPSDVFSTLITKKLIYTPTGFHLVLNADGTVSLYWDSNNEYAGEYILEYSSESDFFQSETLIIPGDKTKYDSLSVELDQAYYFRLVAKNRYYMSEPTDAKEIFVTITALDPSNQYALLYPNPARDFVYFNWGVGTESATQVMVTDLSGRNLHLAYNSALGGFDISKIRSGLYFVRCGDKIQKFVKE